uniref:Uncharacterized protein n=1 Tax=Rhizophora mucronata TaxID=61149 RepID=A0A2P2PKV0_RHIMU
MSVEGSYNQFSITSTYKVYKSISRQKLHSNFKSKKQLQDI